jgi:hypothetical protein
VISENPKLNDHERVQKCDQIYNIALNEILRQLSIDCYERAELLHNIWMSYLSFFKKFRQRILDEAEVQK